MRIGALSAAFLLLSGSALGQTVATPTGSTGVPSVVAYRASSGTWRKPLPVSLVCGVDGSGNAQQCTYAQTNTSGQIAAPIVGAVAPSVTSRAPTSTDDSAHGYAAGNLWNVPGLGLWLCTDATAGKAIWTAQPTGILPLDSISGVSAHGWGTRKLRAAYTGSLLTVGSTDIPADGEGNLSSSSLTVAAGAPTPVSTSGASPQTWSGGVTNWYDQTAATAVNLTVPNGSDAPQISPMFRSGGSPHVAFASAALNYLSTAQTPRMPRLSGSLGALNSQSMTLFTVGRSTANGNAVGALAAMVGIANTTPYTVALMSSVNSPSQGVYGSAAAMIFGTIPVNTGVWTPETPSVLSMVSTASGVKLADDDNATWSGPALASLSETSASDVLILNGTDTTTGNAQGGMTISAAIYVNSALTAAQQLALRESLTDTFKLTPQVRDRIIIAGASTEAGAYGWMGNNPAAYAAQGGFVRPFQVYNQAVGSQPMGPSSTTTSTLALFPNMIAPLVSSYGRTFVYLGEGSAGNSLINGRTAAQTEADFTTFRTLTSALGSKVSLLTATVMPAALITSDTDRTSYNTWLASQGVPLVDLAGQPTLGSSSITTDRTMTYSDGVHHTPYYQSQEGVLLGAAVNSILLSTPTP